MMLAFGITLTLLLGGAAVEQHYLKKTKSQFPPPGQILEIDLERVHVHVQGNSGTPIVFLAGLGNSPLAFSWVIDELRDEYKLIAYDRPGTGWSEPSKAPPTAGHAADTLAEALQQLDVNQPVILVAHSYGGVVARIFHQRYPEFVSGIVFVDSAHEDQTERLPGFIGTMSRIMLHKGKVQKWLARFGILRIPGAVSDEGHGLPPAAQRTFNAITASATNRAGSEAEANQWYASQQEAHAARQSTNTPVTVLVADQWPDAMLPTWLKLQSDIADQSTRGQLEIMKGADHVSIIYSQKYSRIVANKIREMAKLTTSQSIPKT